MQLSDGEKLILHMLSEIHAHLKIKGGVDAEFVQAAITDGNLWALKDRYTGIFDVPEAPEHVVQEVQDILFMWSMLERDFAALPAGEQRRIVDEVGLAGESVRFDGFDGNNESFHIRTARFIVAHLGKFEAFKGRDLDSHSRSLDMHRRMLVPFKAGGFEQGRLRTETIVAVLKARYER